MNVFNRVVTTLLLLALIPIITVGLIVPNEAAQVLSDAFGRLESNLADSVSTFELFVRIVLAVAIDALLVLLLYLQVRRRAVRGVPLQEVTEGEALVSIESIVDRLKYHVDGLPGVLDVKPKVAPRGQGIEVTMEIAMAADANMRTNADTISAVTRRVVEDEIGLQLKGKPRLRLRTVAYPGPITRPEAHEPPFALAAGEEVDIEESVEAEPYRPSGAVDVFEVDDSDEPGSTEPR